jgi:pyruvate dehydrogenase E2 component (dihydrolipoamide acetyltransferase)
VRKYAKDLGVDLESVAGSGPGGVITRADVDAAASGRTEGAAVQEAAGVVARHGGEQRIPIKGVRKHMAAAMVGSAFTAPHVTEFLTVDVTRMMRLRARIAARPEMAGLKVSPLLFVAKALLLAVRRNPMINSSWDEAAQEIVVKDHVNLGIAAATPRGLVVPNVKGADRMSLPELATALSDLTETARAGRTAPEDMSGGTITITNVGVFGVDTGTPILNPGEAAILCFGAVREQPWVVEGRGKKKVKIRQVTQLSLSFDHRIVDGELGSRFLADVGAMVSDPGISLAF